jgi:hypothetical protein
MKSLILRLLTLNGDELGRLPLPEVHLPEAGASGSTPVRPHLTEQMEALYARIIQAVEAEQMEVALSPIEMQITVSRVLLASDDAAEIVIDLPVRASLPKSNAHETPEPLGVPVPPAEWNDLWQLEETQ